MCGPSILKTFKRYGSVGTDSDVLSQFVRQTALLLFNHPETLFQVGEVLAVLFFNPVKLLLQLFDGILFAAFGWHAGGLGEDQVWSA